MAIPDNEPLSKELFEALKRVLDADIAFFNRFPKRENRLRVTSKAELKRLTDFGAVPESSEYITLTLAHKIDDGIEGGVDWHYFECKKDNVDVDKSEEECRAIFDRFAHRYKNLRRLP
jgi:hypothetical protein